MVEVTFSIYVVCESFGQNPYLATICESWDIDTLSPKWQDQLYSKPDLTPSYSISHTWGMDYNLKWMIKALQIQ